MSNPGVAISMLYPIMKTIVSKGFDTEQFFRYASFDSNLLQDVEVRLGADELARLMVAAAEYTQDDYFGLHQGQLVDFIDMGILGYVMMHSRTVAEALAAYQRYNIILSEGFNLDWQVQGDDLFIELSLQQAGQVSRHCVEDMASTLHRLMGKLSNRRIELRDIQFAHAAPADIQPYLSVFGRAPRFGAGNNGLRMGMEVLQYPVMYSDPRLLDIFEGMAKQTKAEMTEPGSVSEQVMQWIEKSMPTCFPTLQQTTEQLGMSARTLQHKLKLEQTSYSDLTARVRKEMAIAYMAKPEMSIGDIAYALHFSEPSAFQSAFKKWTGVAPGQYRMNTMKEQLHIRKEEGRESIHAKQ